MDTHGQQRRISVDELGRYLVIVRLFTRYYIYVLRTFRYLFQSGMTLRSLEKFNCLRRLLKMEERMGKKIEPKKEEKKKTNSEIPSFLTKFIL